MQGREKLMKNRDEGVTTRKGGSKEKRRKAVLMKGRRKGNM